MEIAITSTDDNSIPSPLAAPQHVGLSPQSLGQIKPVVQKFIEEEQLAGAIIMVARRGQVAYFQTYGMMDLQAQRPMQKEAIFRIYSMTKPVAAAAVMMLYQEGRLDLDAPVVEYLPALGGMKVVADPEAEEVTLVEAEREMTVRDLMRHTSGLPGANRYMAAQTALGRIYRQAGLHRLDQCDLQQMVERLGTIPLLYQPGTKWHYSIAADVLGRLIEVVSHQDFDEFLAQHIFRPLQMEDTSFYVPVEKIDRLVDMYGPRPAGGLQSIQAPQGGTGTYSQTSFIKQPKFLSAGGGLVSTATDFMRFCLMLSNKGQLDGTRLLEVESVEQMTRNQLPPPLIPLDKNPIQRYQGLGFGLGVSVRVQQTNWVPASRRGEYGWIGGTSTEFWISPQDELVTITLAQHMPFSDLSWAIKPIIYTAIDPKQE